MHPPNKTLLAGPERYMKSDRKSNQTEQQNTRNLLSTLVDDISTNWYD